MDNVLLWLPTIILGVIALVLMAIWVRYTFSAPLVLPTIQDEHPSLPSPPKARPIQPAPSMVTVLEVMQLIVKNGSNAEKIYDLKSGEVYVGRLENPEEGILIALDEKSVSRRHAKLTANNEIDELSIQDCGSSYGTQLFHGDAPPLSLEANKEYVLRNGDILQFGSLIQAQVVLPGASSSDNPADQMTMI